MEQSSILSNALLKPRYANDLLWWEAGGTFIFLFILQRGDVIRSLKSTGK